MKFYRIKIQLFYPNNRIASTAIGDKIPNISLYFNKIKNGEIITDAPLFDYFYLESYDKKKYWEWQLTDVQDLRGDAIHIPCWLISEKLKNVFRIFNIPSPNCFYHSKLLYRNNKSDFYIFQFTGNMIYETTLEYISFPQSVFLNPITNEKILVENKDQFLLKYDEVSENNDLKRIQFEKLVLKESLDFFPLNILMLNDIVSERLKQAIENAGITGFEFSELDYDVVVEE